MARSSSRIDRESSDEDSSSSSSTFNKNIELVSSFKQSFNRIFNDESDIKNTHLFIDSCYHHAISSTMGLNSIIDQCASCNLLQSTLTNNQLNKLTLTSTSIPSKFIFFIASYLWDYSDVIKMILDHFDWSTSIVYCSMSEIAHLTHPHPPTQLSSILSSSPSIYDYYKSQFYQLIDNNTNDQIDCMVEYFTCNYSVPFPNLFTIPLQYNILPSLYFNQLDSNSNNNNNVNNTKIDIKLNKLPFGIQLDTHKTIHSLLSFIGDQKLGSVVGEDLSIYPIGQYSQFIAQEIHSTLTTTNKQQVDDYHPISLILIDRYLDLVGPSSHSENALDRIYNTISSSTTTTPNINITPIYHHSISNQLPKLYGTISGRENGGGESNIWNSILNKSLREVITILKRKIIDIVSIENINFDVATISTSSNAMNTQSLMTMLSLITSTSKLSLRYSDVVEALTATIQTLQCSQHLHWDNILSIERILLLGYGDDQQLDDEEDDDDYTPQSILSQITDIINSPVSNNDKSYYSIQEILSLCIYAFSLVGDKSFSKDDQSKLIDTLLERINTLSIKEIKENEFLKLILNIDDDDNEEEEEEDKDYKTNIEYIISILSEISKSRKGLHEFKSLVSGGMTGCTYQSLVSQVVRAILQQKEFKDLEKYNGASKLGSLLTGFGMGGWRSKKTSLVSDNRKIIIYVMGGISFQELKECQDIVDKMIKSSPLINHQIIFGSNQISTSNSILDYLR